MAYTARPPRTPRAPRAPRSASAVTTLPVADLGSGGGAATANGRRRSSGDLVADHIRRLIYEGRLTQGDHLRQDEIAAELGVSRIPVREAVIALDREGWLMIEPHRGAFVHALDEDTVRDHYEVFGLIYGLTARRATERAGGDQGGQAVADLVAAQRVLKQADDPDAFFVANNDFLRQLFAMANSSRLASLSRLLRNLVPGNFFAEVPGAMANQKRGTAAITKAVRNGDGSAAEQECRTLMQRQGDAVVALLASRKLFRSPAPGERNA